MPSTMPGISATEAQRLLQATDHILTRFPEVERVLGKAGRAESSTDPAPLSMLETVVVLRPPSEWRRRTTWYSSWAPAWLLGALRRVTPDHISQEELVAEMDEALRVPGVANAWTMPVKGRIDMLSTGLRTAVGLKIAGVDLRTLDRLGQQIESVLSGVRGTRSVFAERTGGGGYFLDVKWERRELARYGLSVDEAQRAVENAVGGDNVTTVVEGRARYPVNVRYLPDFRGDSAAIGRVLVPVSAQRQVPVAQLAEIRSTTGPSMIRDENGLLTAYVYVDVAGRDAIGYVEEARKLVAGRIAVPPGYTLSWTGQYESMVRVRKRLAVAVPLTLLLVFVLLYLNTRSIPKTLIVLLAVPFSAVGAVWFLYALGYNLSVGVWVGLIALLGVDAETGVFMLLYLDLSYDKAKAEGRMTTSIELHDAILHGAARRLRPKLMTVATMLFGLVPVMWAAGTGSDVMKRIAAPLIGGIVTSFALELLVYPAIYEAWKWHAEVKRLQRAA
jgi:copper/silver efflux system protein